MTTTHEGRAVHVRLSAMMFLQFFTWGAWAPTLGACFSANGLSDWTANTYMAGPIAAIIAPLFLGFIADRLFPSQIVFGALMLLAAGFMYLAIDYAESGQGRMVYWMFIGHMLCYMPTLGLGNSISFASLADQNEFPAIRVWGTIGWIVAGLLVGYLGWSAEFNIMWLTFASSLVLALYSFTLPHTPPPAKGEPLDVKSLLMVDAFRMLTEIPFLVFIVCSTLICIPLAYYYAFTSNLLTTAGFEQAASTMTVGQMSEVFFMMLIPFFFRRLGVKWMILVGMGAWVVRYLLFAFGAPEQIIWMLLLGLLMHGVCYDFFFVTGFMYTDKKAPRHVKGQAQSMLVFFTQGVGMYCGFTLAKWRYGATMTNEPTLAKAIAAARETESLSFVDKLTNMFNVSMPAGVDPTLLATTMNEWKTFWLVPAAMAAVILVIFALTFFERPEIDAAIEATDESTGDPPAAEAAPV